MALRLALPALRASARVAAPSLAPAPRRAFTSTTRALAEAVATPVQAQASAAAKPKSSGAGRRWGIRLAVLLAVPVAYFAGAVAPPNVVLLLSPRYSPPPPDKDSKHGKALTEDVERELQDLFVVAEMRTKKDWYEARPYERFDPQKVHNSLTAGSLRGPGKLAIPPLAFAKNDETEAVLIVHLGRALCGHDGIIHGGLIATVFDESLARNALMNIDTHIGVTATLTLNYRSPCMADQFVIVRTKLDDKQGRKIRVSGTMETLDGERIADANALFVEPKWAQFLQSSGVTEALGAPTSRPNPAAERAV